MRAKRPARNPRRRTATVSRSVAGWPPLPGSAHPTIASVSKQVSQALKEARCELAELRERFGGESVSAGREDEE